MSRIASSLAARFSIWSMLPEPTPLFCEARDRGLSVADGLAMLSAQGEAAFQLWFSIAPELHIMQRELKLDF